MGIFIKSIVAFLLICSFNPSLHVDGNSKCDPRLQKEYEELEVQYKKNEKIIKGLRTCFDARYRDHGYYFIREKITWDDAKQRCEDVGGHVAFQEFKNITQQDKVMGFLNGSLHFNSNDYEIWIGATGNNRVFYWPSNPKQLISTDATTGWCKGEPNNNNGNEKCLHYNRWSGKKRHPCLNDIRCDKKNYVLCEIKCN